MSQDVHICIDSSGDSRQTHRIDRDISFKKRVVVLGHADSVNIGLKNEKDFHNEL